MRIALLFASVVAFTVYGCNSTTAPSVTGSWGSTDASLILSPEGGSVTLACAEGTIDAGWSLATNGQWTAAGRYAITAGPVPIEGRPMRPVRYDGLVNRNRLEFQITFMDTNEVVGPIAVMRGRSGPATRCE